MTDEELGQYIKQYGDRLALRAFCHQRTVTNEKSGVETVKSALMHRVRDRLGEHRKTSADRDTEGSGIVGSKQSKPPGGLRWDGSTLITALITRSKQDMEVEHGTCQSRHQ